MDCGPLVQRQRAFYQTGSTQSLAFRRAQLRNLAAALDRHEASLLAALQADLHKSPFQGYSSELGWLQSEIRHTLRHLNRWAAPTRARTPWMVAPARGWEQPEPFGLALILGPWNYPVQLLLAPLVSAMAAGNCAVLKPSELAMHSAGAVAALVRDTFPDHYIEVVLGGAEAAEALLHEKFDKIFFTGSTRIGRAVMAAAAKQLTPVSLELGGKCPVIVCADAAIELAAKRIAWGKFLNAGQTCVAPDFVLVQRGVHQGLVAALIKVLREFYGADASQSPDYGRIVNARHFERLTSYLSDGKILHGGDRDANALFLAPTLLGEVSPLSPVMQEEIFGPILPIVEFEDLDNALSLLRNRPTPLALYLFTSTRETEAKVLAGTRSGGACVNDVVAHIFGTGLSFGGLGESGLGAYHGRAGFESFSHRRAIMRRATWLDTPFRYPPQKISLAGLKRSLKILLRS